MQEYKHTDVFYVKVAGNRHLGCKSVDGSEIAQSTEMHSERESPDFSSALLADNNSETLVTYERNCYRLFDFYFYRINVEYAGEVFSDCLLLERDALCDNFFELYLKDLLASQLQEFHVTYHEANRKLSRHKRSDNAPIFRPVRFERRA